MIVLDLCYIVYNLSTNAIFTGSFLAFLREVMNAKENITELKNENFPPIHNLNVLILISIISGPKRGRMTSQNKAVESLVQSSSFQQLSTCYFLVARNVYEVIGVTNILTLYVFLMPH